MARLQGRSGSMTCCGFFVPSGRELRGRRPFVPLASLRRAGKRGPFNAMRTIIVLLLIAAGAASAQDKTDDAKKRMVFPAVKARPTSSASLDQPAMALTPTAPTPTPPPLAPGPVKAPDPINVVESFFFALKGGQVDAAYDELVSGTIIADRKEDVTSLKTRTKQALDSYGPVSGFEPVETIEIGTCLRRHTCISLNQDLPLRWKFYFYRNASGWRLVDLRVDDGLAELFDDVARNRKK